MCLLIVLRDGVRLARYPLHPAYLTSLIQVGFISFIILQAQLILFYDLKYLIKCALIFNVTIATCFIALLRWSFLLICT